MSVPIGPRPGWSQTQDGSPPDRTSAATDPAGDRSPAMGDMPACTHENRLGLLAFNDAIEWAICEDCGMHIARRSPDSPWMTRV